MELAVKHPIASDVPQVGLGGFNAARLRALRQPHIDQLGVVVGFNPSLGALPPFIDEREEGGVIGPSNEIWNRWRRELGECPV